ALVLLPDATTPTAVRNLLGVPAAPGRDSLNRLRELAIVWRTPRSLHLVRVVRYDVGPHAACLGPTVRAALSTLTAPRLGNSAKPLGLTTSDGPTSGADAIAAHLTDRDSLETLLTDLGDDAREALSALATGPPHGRIDDARRAVDLASARSP